MRILAVISGLAVALLWTAAPAFADDGCARALAATTNTPGHAFVAIHCTSQGTTPSSTTPRTDTETGKAAAQTGVQGCALGLASATGTPGEPFVRAACSRLASELGVPAPAAPNPPAAGDGCALAVQAVMGTTAEPFVRAGCAQATSTGEGAGAAATGVAAVTMGCDVAIQATTGTTAEPFVRAGCAEAVANATAASPSAEEATVTADDEDQSQPSDDMEEDNSNAP